MHDLRPCEVTFEKETIEAYFHCFYTEVQIVPPSLLKGGHTGGQLSTCLALVEYKDGTVHSVTPQQIRFIKPEPAIKNGARFKISKSTDKDIVQSISKALKENDGYCPCATHKTEDTKCMCKAFREQQVPGPCHCGLYIKE